MWGTETRRNRCWYHLMHDEDHDILLKRSLDHGTAGYSWTFEMDKAVASGPLLPFYIGNSAHLKSLICKWFLPISEQRWIQNISLRGKKGSEYSSQTGERSLSQVPSLNVHWYCQGTCRQRALQTLLPDTVPFSPEVAEYVCDTALFGGSSGNPHLMHTPLVLMLCLTWQISALCHFPTTFNPDKWVIIPGHCVQWS